GKLYKYSAVLHIAFKAGGFDMDGIEVL
ncbi:MAG: hypothetical protein QOE33_3779, partial [Acidobacteriota bacterium]|nr:hypothetical protein [Acidobacteriota bacterium]